MSQKTLDGRSIVTLWPTEGTKTNIATHRWNDPTTWYQGATEKTLQMCTVTTSGTAYQMPDVNIIDVTHGKIWAEEQKLTHCVSVEVDEGAGWVVKTEEDPHNGVGEYNIDYATGVITFDPAIATDADVRASYYAAGSSVFTIAPTTGRQLVVKAAEVQFSEDYVMTDSVVFELYGFVEVFAPQLVNDVDPNYVSSFPTGTKIPIRKTLYKTMGQFIDESNGSNPVIPALGGGNWRGMPVPVNIFSWDYAAAIPISDAKGMEVRIYLVHDVPFGGSYSTATLYCLSEVEA